MVADYFALGDSEASSDDGHVGKLIVDVSTGTRTRLTCDSDTTVRLFVHIIIKSICILETKGPFTLGGILSRISRGIPLVQSALFIFACV